MARSPKVRLNHEKPHQRHMRGKTCQPTLESSARTSTTFQLVPHPLMSFVSATSAGDGIVSVGDAEVVELPVASQTHRFETDTETRAQRICVFSERYAFG
ncbi:hypothetical protein LY76DRAFT_594533 [Colletotrichum caudatum]|nr:hypothetical protein LY76DRAFT_594533 [Colletotrichum caudatum]